MTIKAENLHRATRALDLFATACVEFNEVRPALRSLIEVGGRLSGFVNVELGRRSAAIRVELTAGEVCQQAWDALEAKRVALIELGVEMPDLDEYLADMKG